MISLRWIQIPFLGLLIFFCSQNAWAAAKEAGKISMIKGDVLILNNKQQIVADPQGKRGRRTAVDAPFFEGETVQTKANARVKLVFHEGGNEVVLGSDTSLVITRAGTQSPGTQLSLNKGTIRSQVLRKYSGIGDDVFEVKTPNSVAGVRGTIFQVNFDINTAKTLVYTETGVVAVRSLTQQLPPQIVTANSYSEVSKASAPTPAKPMDDAKKQNMILINSEGEPKSDTKSDTKNETPSSATSKPEESSSQADSKPAKKSDAAPAVALAPKPADTLADEGNRAPAGSSSTPTQKIMLPSSNTASAIMNQVQRNPMDLVNQQTETMRRQMEESLRQQRLIEGNTTEATVSIK
jgi:hypothetical protein